MKSELSRRDFLKIAGAGLGALAFGGLLSACEGKDSRCDPEHVVTLKEGDYMFAGEYRIDFCCYKYLNKWTGLESIYKFNRQPTDIDVANLNIIREWPEGEWDPTKPLDLSKEIELKIGDSYMFTDAYDKKGPKRVIYRCGHDTFAFWDLKEFPVSTPTPTHTPGPTETPTRTPAAILP